MSASSLSSSLKCHLPEGSSWLLITTSPPVLIFLSPLTDLQLSLSIYHLLIHSHILLACILYCLPSALEWRHQEAKGVLSLILFSPTSIPSRMYSICYGASHFPSYMISELGAGNTSQMLLQALHIESAQRNFC